ncbi:MAG: multi-component regulatory system-3 [Dactylosporangium sp.]|nr:multi-component regulatory system-3 [Dactylosporangium sp.]
MSIPRPRDEPWLDDDAGRLVRPYTVSNGRTRPTTKLDLLSMVMTTGRVPQAHLEPDHARALGLCDDPTTVAEVAAHLKLPAVITKVLLSDLVDCGAVSTRAPGPAADPTDRSVLEAVLDGLRRRL